MIRVRLTADDLRERHDIRDGYVYRMEPSE